MKKVLTGVVFLLVIAIGGPLLFSGILSAAEPDKIVQSGAILTVAESKRLIGKAVAQMPIVKNALANGMSLSSRGQPMPTWQRRSLGIKRPLQHL